MEYFDGYIYAGATPIFIPHQPQPLPKYHDPMMNDMVNYLGNEFKFIQD